MTRDPIHVFEVQVFSAGVNVARSATASAIQSTTLGAFQASNAVDGNAKSFSHTDEKGFAWWEVNLGGPFPIESVKIMNRWCKNPDDPNGCLCRLSHAAITLFDDGGKWVAAKFIGETCGELEVDIDFPCSGA